ncbi:hypothetical protein CHS0354_013743 [Potamilus streckersoni]|uniref:Cadherin domain-containing protein n=1 Tax=Potamilus streckersoni TaxID=2493646 RepID=A0AAE0SGM7_9BIVA|nr:hypothetical protein CHS0354_013743 [Potamilus streckersoni]
MKYYSFTVLFIHVVNLSAGITQPNACIGVNTIGEADETLNASPVSETDTGTAYLIAQPAFNCCGVVKLWKAYIKHNGTIKFDIWRSLSDGINFRLVGTHEFRIVVSSDSLLTLSIPPAAQYTVYPGDNIGWYTPVKEMIAYTVNSSSQVKSCISRPSSHPLGSVLNWSTASRTINTYAIGAQYDVNSAPMFVNLDAYIQVVPPIAIGTVIYTISATDPDVSDTSITQLTYSNTSGNGLFSFDSTTRHVIVSANLTATAGYHCITFEVEDICQNKDTGSLCIFIYNEPPTVTCNPQTATIIETTNGNVALTTMVVSDPTDDVTCSAPNIAPFMLKMEKEYKIFVNANPGFRVSTRDFYSLSITCNDNKNSTTAMCNIQILPSAPPRFINLPGLISVSTVNVITNPVYDVLVADPDSKSFNFSATCKHISCPFTINNTGSIQLDQDLLDRTIGGYDLYITVTDGYNNAADTLTVTISDVNVPPKFINLPLTTVLYVPENTALGSTVYKVSATDNDGDALTYNMASSPVTGMTYFSIDRSNGIITTSTVRAINYEEIKNTTWTFTVSVDDGKVTVK